MCTQSSSAAPHLSGFLVSSSLERRGSVRYAESRKSGKEVRAGEEETAGGIGYGYLIIAGLWEIRDLG